MKRKTCFLSLILGLSITATLNAATATVTNNGDANSASTCIAPAACSLRQAINRVNTNVLTDTIDFALSGVGPHVIAPTTELPILARPVNINGYSQAGAVVNTSATGFNAVLKIQLSGANMPVGSAGLRLQDATASSVQGLSITGFSGSGARAVEGNGAGLLIVTGCAIGVTPTFAAAGNATGILTGANQTGAVRIGTLSATSPRATNLISQNTQHAIVLSAVTAAQTGTSFIGHNLINVSADGSTFLNSLNSVLESRGGMTINANVIGGSRSLILNSAGFVVTGNRIGGDLQPISIESGAGVGTVGGVGALANIITTSNGGAAPEPTLIRNIVNAVNADMSLNRMFVTGSGAPVGIDLGGNGVTPNDSGDPDTGPNGLQNFPEIASATRTSATGVVSISGTLNSLPNRSFRLVFYANPVLARAGEFLGDSTTDVVTDASGNASFGPLQLNFGNGATVVNHVSATATLIDNVSMLPFATSEFAASIPIQLVTPPATFTVTSVDDPGNGICDSTCTLREAIVAANATGSATAIDEIRFNIPGAGPHTIILGSALPALTQSVTIDGYTQPGALVNTDATGVGTNAVLKIEIRPATLNNFNFAAIAGPSATNLTLRGLSFVGFFELIRADLGAASHIEGCWFGVRPDGTELFTSIQILLRGDSKFGGANPAQRNIWDVASNIFSRNSTVQNNLFGVLPSGRIPASVSAFTGGGGGALQVENSLVQDNVFSTANGATAIAISTGFFSTIADNAMGESFDGVTALGLDNGVDLSATFASIAASARRIRGAQVFGIRIASGIHFINQKIVGGAGKGIVLTGGLASIRSAISGTAGLGIDLNNDGVTLNDLGDTDTGPNGLQNFPALTSAVRNASTISVTGTLNSLPNQNFRILLCGIATEHSSLHGGCDDVLDDETIVTTAANGNTGFSVTVANNAAHNFITATASRIVSATDEQTSEFALNIPIVGFQEIIFANGFEGN